MRATLEAKQVTAMRKKDPAALDKPANAQLKARWEGSKHYQVLFCLCCVRFLVPLVGCVLVDMYLWDSHSTRGSRGQLLQVTAVSRQGLEAFDKPENQGLKVLYDARMEKRRLMYDQQFVSSHNKSPM